MVTVTFHMLLLLNSPAVGEHPPALARFAMILLGFLIAALATTLLWPAFAGDALHALAVTNLEAIAQALERSVL